MEIRRRGVCPFGRQRHTPCDETQLTDDQKVYLRQFFYDRLNGLVNPIGLNEIDNLGRLEDNRIYLLVERKEAGDDGMTRYAIVKTSPS